MRRFFSAKNMLLFLGIISLLGAVLVLLHKMWTRGLQEIERRELQELVDETVTLTKTEKANHAHLKEKNY